MGKVGLFLELFRKGSAVADPKLWRDRAALTIALSAFLLALNAVANWYGYNLGLQESDINTIAATIGIVVGLFSHYATHEEHGILPARADAETKLQTELDLDNKTQADLRGGP